MFKFFLKIPSYTVMIMIRLYQKTLSLDHGWFKFLFPYGYCQFYPTCSEYGHQSIHRHGLIKGGWLAFWRVLRCNPWSSGGEDPVPPIKLKNKKN